MSATMERTRRLAAPRDIRRGAYLTDGEVLLEVRAVRGLGSEWRGGRPVPRFTEALVGVCFDDPDTGEPMGGRWLKAELVLMLYLVTPEYPIIG